MADNSEKKAPPPQLPDDVLDKVITSRVKLNALVKDQNDALKVITQAIQAQSPEEQDEEMIEAALDVIMTGIKGIAAKTRLEQIDTLLMGQLSKEVPSKSNAHATIARTHTDYYRIEDMQDLVDYALETNDLDMFTQKVRKEWCASYVEEHEKMPPGVTKWTDWKLSVVKKRTKLKL